MKQSTKFTSEMMSKRVKTILMIALLCMGTLSARAQSGYFGEDNALHWEIQNPFGYGYGHSTLVISGTGDMPNEAFEYWSIYIEDIKSVIIGNGVTSIGSWAFANHRRLQSVSIGYGVKSIGNGAFGGCKYLWDIFIPETVESIGEEAFYSCENLGSIEIFGYDMTIGDRAFSDCTGLTSVKLVGVICGNRAFANSGLKNIEIEYVELRGDDIFSGCSQLTFVTIGSGVKSIGNGAFSNCSSLASITIPIGVTSIGHNAFLSCNNLTYIDISSSVISIGDAAFQYCTGLTSLAIGDGVKSIGYSAFYGCEGLTLLIIPNGVTSIGPVAFAECIGLTSIEIPNSVISSLDDAFYKCTGLTSIKIGSGVTSIKSTSTLNPFGSCNKLQNIEVDGANPSFSSKNGVLFDKGKTTLLAYPLGRSGSYTIPDGVINIGIAAFGGNNGLTSVTIPNSVRTIGQRAFSKCNGITSVTIPDGVTSIVNGAFSSCRNLVSVTIPKSVTDINDNSFLECVNLTSVTNLKATPQNINSSVFSLTNLSAATLYVPSSAKSAYEAAPVWQNFGTIIELSYSPVSQPYPNIMNFTVAVSLDGNEIQNGRYEIGAFSDNECRGSAVLQSIPAASQQSNSHGAAALQYAPADTQHSYLGFLSVYGNGDENITFKIFDHDTGKEYEATIAPVAFAIDATYGSTENPYQITIVSNPVGNCKLKMGDVHIYPDSSGEKLIIQYPWNNIDRLEIADLNGRILWQESGFASESVNIASLAKGMYILKLVKDNRVSVHKFIKK